MKTTIASLIRTATVEAWAPCRVDMGGTLDIPTFYYPMQHLEPCTFNIALDLRTRVRLRPYASGKVKVSSRGFRSATYTLPRAPFDHPLGLMFAVAAHFAAAGVHIDIQSDSPPRGALGGSSAAAVALVAAFARLREHGGAAPLSADQVAMLAHGIESSVAQVPCGLQDQLAAAHGGVRAWYWHTAAGRLPYTRKTVLKKGLHDRLKRHLLLAYCGMPHASKDINGRWVRQFTAGKHRGRWVRIVGLTHAFVDALSAQDISRAVAVMRAELALRRKMTPDVLDDVGRRLSQAAVRAGCGARFTGAGGGGCIWALGMPANIDRLRKTWEGILAKQPNAGLLPAKVAAGGVSCVLNAPSGADIETAAKDGS